MNKTRKESGSGPLKSREASPSASVFPVVGIGASAGGLAAFEAFFSGLPADTEPGMAFVLVQHLAPDHKSLLVDLVGRYTRMKVFEVVDGMRVMINCAYIIPPGHDMAFQDGCLRLLEPGSPRGQRLPIDFFFRSLAHDQRDRSIAIVLSGTGADGSLGIRAIKAEGGMVMVQSPERSEFDGMPRSALATGLVDFELDPSSMGSALIDYAAHAFGRPPLSLPPPSSEKSSLEKVFALLREHTGQDFSQYKSATVARRLERRMAVNRLDSLEGYVQFLDGHDEEVEALFRDLLIGVTGFFRDPEAFEALGTAIAGKIIEGKAAGSVIRVWSPGCSTGEEAYSLAILFTECMERAGKSLVLQIFATDIDARAIAKARAGIYPASITADVSVERLARYFTAEPDMDDGPSLSYRINRNIRDLLIFSEQNVIGDPPFSRMDLISCRNLMIYLSSKLQKKLLPLFHYALKPGGLLFLGTSETVGEFTDSFEALDRKEKIYQRTGRPLMGGALGMGGLPVVRSSAGSAEPKAAGQAGGGDKEPLRELTERTLLARLAPSSALVNGQGDILYIHGRTGLYLEPAEGLIGAYNIINMAREGLKQELTIALHRAAQTKAVVTYAGLRVKTDGDAILVNLTVCPAESGTRESSSPPLYLVLLQDVEEPGPGPVAEAVPMGDAERDRFVAALMQQLKAKEEYLQNANEELETANEELRSSNEEMQSVNEELQSTNEELETSKEELQSVNEELATVNAELQTKVEDLSTVNNDMNNLLAGTGIATIFLDCQLRVLRFTPAASMIVNLVKSDAGRPIAHFMNNLVGYETMMADVQAVLETLVPREVDVRTGSGQWYTMRILPYRTIENVIMGVVITFMDITEKKMAGDKIKSLMTERDLVRDEVNLRVRNNMSAMRALLEIQAGKSGDAPVKPEFEAVAMRLQCMEDLNEKAYHDSPGSHMSIQAYLRPLVDEFASSSPQGVLMTIDNRIDDFALDAGRLQLLGMLVNELLMNIKKHAFAGRSRGSVLVSATSASGAVAVIVGDDGIGIPESVTMENSTGLGLSLVLGLAGQMDGTIRIERNSGTRFVLEFAL